MSALPHLPAPVALEEQRGQSLPSLIAIMQLLLSEDGCPWDREQTLASLKPYVLEEACEVMDAIDSGDPAQLCDELGDLTLQIVFLAELARKVGAFGPDDVVRAIAAKLIRRHPHVFGEVRVSSSGEVARNWEAIKHEEKRERPLLGGVPRSLPALLRATRVSERVARVGFDWPNRAGSRAKVAEEIEELDEALSKAEKSAVEHELGDLLFALVNLARHAGVDAEAALQQATDRFTRRFENVERGVKARHGDWPRGTKGEPTRGIALDELDGYWEEAKQHERAQQGSSA